MMTFLTLFFLKINLCFSFFNILQITLISLRYNKMAKEQSRTITSRMLHRHRTRAYVSVKYQDRVALIEQIVFKNRRIVDVSKEIGINCSTAKMIIYRYKRSGIIYEKKEQKEVREERQKAYMIWYWTMYQIMYWQNYWRNSWQYGYYY